MSPATRSAAEAGDVPDHARTADPRVIVSIHDIAPGTAEETRGLLTRLDALGVRRRVLKVVPRWADRDDLLADASLCELLRTEAANGSEIVLHGWTHHLDRPPVGPLLQRWRVRLFAPHAAELAAFDDVPAMRDRIDRGTAVLREAGLRATGYCPPAWIAGPALDVALREAGYRYVLRMTTVTDLLHGRTLRIPSVGYMGAGPRQEAGIELQRDRTLRRPPGLVRLFLHPQGATASPACDRTFDRLTALLRTHHPVTYAEAL